MKAYQAFVAGVVHVAAVAAFGSSIDLYLQTPAGQTKPRVACGATVSYHVMGDVSNNDNQGLSVWGADLVLTGPSGSTVIPLERAVPPGGAPMSAFVAPEGINNPNVANPTDIAGGYGGTPGTNDPNDPGNIRRLLQMGGGQNSIRNDGAGSPPYPSGEVIANVARNARILAVGWVTLPAGVEGDFTLHLENTFANTFVANALDDPDNAPYFRTQAAEVNFVSDLVITAADTDASSNPIVAANPPAFNPYSTSSSAARFRDVLENTTTGLSAEGIGASGTPDEGIYSYATIAVRFCSAPSDEPDSGDVTISCTGGTCPTISSVSGSGAGPYTIALSGQIPPRECTTITFTSVSGSPKLQYQSLPGDVNRVSATLS